MCFYIDIETETNKSGSYTREEKKLLQDIKWQPRMESMKEKKHNLIYDNNDRRMIADIIKMGNTNSTVT